MKLVVKSCGGLGIDIMGGMLNVIVADVVEPGATWTVTGRLTLDPCVTTCASGGTLSSKSNSLVGLDCPGLDWPGLDWPGLDDDDEDEVSSTSSILTHACPCCLNWFQASSVICSEPGSGKLARV